MEEFELVIDTEEMQEVLYNNLVEYGFVPETEELEVIADIMFDYLISKTIITEVEDEQ